MAADVGFAAATTNPFTVQIAQGHCRSALGSDLGFRVIFYLTCMTATLALHAGLWPTDQEPARTFDHGHGYLPYQGIGTTDHLYPDPCSYLDRGDVCRPFISIIYGVQTRAGGWPR